MKHAEKAHKGGGEPRTETADHVRLGLTRAIRRHEMEAAAAWRRV
ncbi:hypothetical protein OG756_33720 [Streptomyces sp. NBC_01310]|nr:hypothetical protein OG756_33720 [Streptomyces sp. NBC_01310]